MRKRSQIRPKAVSLDIDDHRRLCDYLHHIIAFASMAEVAQEKKCSRQNIHYAVKTNTLTAFRIGKQVCIMRDRLYETWQPSERQQSAGHLRVSRRRALQAGMSPDLIDSLYPLPTPRPNARDGFAPVKPRGPAKPRKPWPPPEPTEGSDEVPAREPIHRRVSSAGDATSVRPFEPHPSSEGVVKSPPNLGHSG